MAAGRGDARMTNSDIAANDLALEVKDLHVSFDGYRRRTFAVNGVNLEVRRGEVVGVVGESGCGKSVTALSIVNLLGRTGRIDRGQILLHTRAGTADINSLKPDSAEMRRIRGREVAMIFQEPMRSLHPMFSVGDQITEGIRQHFDVSRKEAETRAVAMLERVGMPQPERVVGSYPHTLSGGMRQRVMIALALACGPNLLIADEPTTALDVTIQAQILDLIRQLQRESGLAVLLITHNMGVIAEIADRVNVMYLGQVVETGSVEQLLTEPRHPYTQGLLASVPTRDTEPRSRLHTMAGTVPELVEPPRACGFARRCPHAFERCTDDPPVVEIQPGHTAKCWLYAEDEKDGEDGPK